MEYWINNVLSIKKITLLAIILISTSVFSQDFEKISELDTIYVLFKQGKNQHKLSIKDYEDNGYYFLGEGGERTVFRTDYIRSYSLENGNYKTENIRKTVVLYKRKSFLRKHKNEIIDNDFMKKHKAEIITKFSKKQRVYFIIDVDDFKKRKIKLTEVNGPATIYID